MITFRGEQEEKRVETLAPLAPDLARIRELTGRYRNLPADFPDASLVALAERMHCTEIITTDTRDFSVYRPRHTQRLTNLLEITQ